LAAAAGHPGALPVVVGILGGGLIGVLDDLSKLRRGSIGIPARAKFPVQILIAIPVAAAALAAGGGDQLLFGSMSPLWYWPLAILALVGTANAVNLTDGLDGLAGSVAAIALVAILEFLPGTSAGEKAGGISLLGVLIAFLVFNRHPAKVFMGDAGSLALGYALAAMAIQQHLLVLLPLLGLVFVLEAASVMIQVASFKATRKRVFRMAPIHYTFQLAGWSENRITLAFALTGLVAAAAAVLVVQPWA
jgi:phospho-N-acetylmuramoyl-pentapeptide-transferase